MMRVGKKVSWILASVLAVSLAGCCNDDNPLGVSESGIAGPTPVLFGSAGSFGILAGSTVTNTGPTTIDGDLGVSPGGSVTGFPPGTLTGVIHAADSTAAAAQSALTAAFLDAQGRTTGAITVAGDLGGRTLTPGLYTSTSSLGVTGDLTLNALGNPNATFLIQAASTLITATGSRVILTNGAQASNVIWVVGSSATLGTDSEFKGTILAQTSATLNTGAQVDGRVLTRTGAVTLDSNVIDTQ